MLSLLSRHRPFAVIIVLALLVRAAVVLGYPPARLYWGDSFSYLDIALDLRPEPTLRPVGYPLLLRALSPLHSVAAVAVVQHLIGVATGVLVYAVARRRSAPVWAANAATVPGLFGEGFLRLEHAILADTLFVFLVVAALSVLLWRTDLGHRAALAAGVLLAYATLVRTIGVLLIGVVVLVLLLRRRGARPLLTLVAAAVLPLGCYAAWYGTHHGRFAVSGADGVMLWARTMTFADCAKIRPPADLAALCPNGTVTDAASEYVWHPEAAVNLLPGGAFANNDRARAFALRAIAAQPLDYLWHVARDTSIAFHWTPEPHPDRTTPAFGFAHGRWDLPGVPLVERLRRDYAPDIDAMRSVSPYADLLIAYQQAAHLRGPVLLAILVAGALRLRRTLLPWAAAMTLLVGPVAVLDFDHRYVLPAIPVACLAAALAAGRRPTGLAFTEMSGFSASRKPSQDVARLKAVKGA
ncbi:hypothetical protein ACIBH1_41110 [Nonomuraea sp. NPDC050663]|uniref:hypothetical protein n=1 Tax=Nonomuraea sp. NPDC050663 TaxID=3364370 RepID=UPI003787FA68